MVIGKETWDDILDRLEKHNRESCDRFWDSLVYTALNGGHITKAEYDKLVSDRSKNHDRS